MSIAETQKTSSATPAVYTLDARAARRAIIAGHLKMGAPQSASGETLTANSFYYLRNGKPFLPVMGEFHYSRYPRAQWEEALLKMKAGGVDIIASYVFWIHHEEQEGDWDWSAGKDLRHFISLCGKHGLYAFPRIGPWSHGECRNGGFPDWLFSRCNARTNDPAYFAYVRRLYEQIYRQVAGLLFKDGGPVIGVQLENEFMHCGGEGGEEHMMRLKQLAREAGFDVPFYTATAWGGSPIPEDEFIPMQGGYPDAPWEPGNHRLAASTQFLFRVGAGIDPRIGSDHEATNSTFTNIAYREDRYPVCMAELGPGNQVKRNRRPIIYDEDAAAMSLTKVAGGANLVGYYMYHGGSHPIGKLSTLEEPGYSVINYDFQAAIGEFGQTNTKYHLLRRFHLFLHDYGDLLAPMVPVLPHQRPEGPEDVETLRFMARVQGDAGFLFVSNYQRYVENKPLVGQIALTLPNGTTCIPRKPFTLPEKALAIWPFNLSLEGVVLKHATAQPLAHVQVDDDAYYFFFAQEDISPEFVFDKASVAGSHGQGVRLRDQGKELVADALEPGTDCVISLVGRTGRRVRVCTLSSQQSLQVYKSNAWGRDRIFLTEADFLFDAGQLTLTRVGVPELSFAVFPDVACPVECGDGRVNGDRDGIFSRYSIRRECKEISVAVSALDGPQSEEGRWRIGVPRNAMNDVHDVFLRIGYCGDEARLFIGDTLVADDMYYGRPWMVGLRRFVPQVLGQEMTLKITPLHRNAKIYMEKEAWPSFSGRDAVIELQSVEPVPEYAAVFRLG